MHVSQLYLYPLKSARGYSVPQYSLDARGPRWDRRWMLVDEAGQFLTQRQHAVMTQLVSHIEDNELQISAPGMPDLIVPFFYWDMIKSTQPVTVWSDTVPAKIAEGHVNAWFSQVLKQPCRLAYMPEETKRLVDPAYAKKGEIASFSDGFPLLLATEASLQQFNQWLGSDIDIMRFRPNVVITGNTAFAEDEWRRIGIGTLEFHVAKPCSRCAIPTLDPITGERNTAVFATLKKHRSREGEVFFGQNLIASGKGEINVGDAVELLE